LAEQFQALHQMQMTGDERAHIPRFGGFDQLRAVAESQPE
jgi:hypothetical protein